MCFQQPHIYVSLEPWRGGRGEKESGKRRGLRGRREEEEEKEGRGFLPPLYTCGRRGREEIFLPHMCAHLRGKEDEEMLDSGGREGERECLSLPLSCSFFLYKIIFFLVKF